jgi:hypothetical protein
MNTELCYIVIENHIMEADVAWPIQASCLSCKKEYDPAGWCMCAEYDEYDEVCACGSFSCDGTCETGDEERRKRKAWDECDASSEISYEEYVEFSKPVDASVVADEEDIPF